MRTNCDYDFEAITVQRPICMPKRRRVELTAVRFELPSATLPNYLPQPLNPLHLSNIYVVIFQAFIIRNFFG